MASLQAWEQSCVAPQDVFSVIAVKWLCSTNRHAFLMLTQGKEQEKYVINTNATASTHFSSSLEGFLMTLHESRWHLSNPWDLNHPLWPETIHSALWPPTFSGAPWVQLEVAGAREGGQSAELVTLSSWNEKRIGQSTLLSWIKSLIWDTACI